MANKKRVPHELSRESFMGQGGAKDNLNPHTWNYYSFSLSLSFVYSVLAFRAVKQKSFMIRYDMTPFISAFVLLHRRNNTEALDSTPFILNFSHKVHGPCCFIGRKNNSVSARWASNWSCFFRTRYFSIRCQE